MFERVTAGATYGFTPQTGLTGDYLWSTLGTQDDWGGSGRRRILMVE